VKQKVKQANDGLNLGAVNASEMTMDVENYIENNIENIIDVAIENSVTQKTELKQVKFLNLRNSTFKCRPGQTIQFGQDMIIDVFAQNIAKTLYQNIIENTSVNKLVQEFDQTADQKNTGLNMNFMGIIIVAVVLVGGGVGKTVMSGGKSWIFLLVLLILITLAIILLYFLWYKPKKEKNENLNLWDPKD
jgi:hypothetical protein